MSTHLRVGACPHTPATPPHSTRRPILALSQSAGAALWATSAELASRLDIGLPAVL